MNCLMNALLKLEKLLMLLASRHPNHLEVRSPKVYGNVRHKRPSLDSYWAITLRNLRTCSFGSLFSLYCSIVGILNLSGNWVRAIWSMNGLSDSFFKETLCLYRGAIAKTFFDSCWRVTLLLTVIFGGHRVNDLLLNCYSL